ncbi:MAG: TldD/PmbA family protein, partial [Candidatus Bathyarchaeia archaeon]
AKSVGEPGIVPGEYVFEGRAPLRVKIDPRKIALEDKVKVAVELEKHVRGEGDQIKVSTGSLSDVVQREIIVNSLGTEVDVSNCYVRVGGSATSREGTLIQNASDSVGTSRGWETVEGVDPAEMGARIGNRAVSLLSAQSPPGGRMNLIMDPSLVGVFIHEAFGHAAEADGVLGNMSVLSGKIGKQVGVPDITVIDDPTIEGLRGSFPYDSEGTSTRRRVIVEEGILKGYYHSLETAAKMGVEPNGAGRAMDFNWKPIPRMGNTYIETGDMSFEELCQEVKEGVYLIKSYGGYVNPSIGQFFFSAQEGHLIKDGEVGPLIQNVSMSGLTLEVLANVIGIGKGVEMAFPGTCGKGGQSAPISGGGPHLAVAKVVVGGR